MRQTTHIFTRLCGVLATAVLSSTVAAQAPAPQIIMHGQAGPAASLTNDAPGARQVYVFWEASEGRLEDLLPLDATLTLLRDGVEVVSFGPRDVASVSDIAERYALATEARRRAATMALLDRAFDTGGPPILGVPDDVDPTTQTFPTVLHSVLSDVTIKADWDPVTSLLARVDPNVAFAMRRGWIEDVPAASLVTYTLMMNGSVELGRVQINTSSNFKPGAPSRLAEVTDGLFRCDSNDWSRVHGAVALTWDHPGLTTDRTQVAAMLASVPLAGYDLYAAPGACPANVDLAALAAVQSFGAEGKLTLPGWRKVNDQPTFISSPAPERQAEATTEYLSTWQPKFAQTMELSATLSELGLRPGDPICYALAALDRTGNYGETATLQAAVGDFQPPEIPWNISAVTQSAATEVGGGVSDEKALYLEWPVADVDNWLWSHGAYYTACNEEDARTGPYPGRLVIAEEPAGCSDPARRDTVRLDAVDYLVYRFDTPHEANAFSDADGDGLADQVERRFDTNYDRVADTPEANLPSGMIGNLPASDPGAACTPDVSPGTTQLVATRPLADAVVGADGRRLLRFSDTTPTANRGEGYWYRVAARSANGRISPLSPPIRASFPDMAKPPPFDLGPNGDAGFFACEPTAYQDDSAPDLVDDRSVGGEFEPNDLSVPAADGGRDEYRRLLGLDLSNQAVALRISCLDEGLIKRAEETSDPAVVRAMVAMRLGSYVGTVADGRRINGQLLGLLPWPAASIPSGSRVLWADAATTVDVCGALTTRAFEHTYDGVGRIDGTVKQCTPYVEFLDEAGRALAPATPVAIRDDGSDSEAGNPCSFDPLAAGCETYACNWMATFESEVCERRLEDAGGIFTGKVRVQASVAKGECAYVEVEQEFPVTDAAGKRTGYEYQPYRLGWQCCKDALGCQVTQDLEPGDFGADNSCYSITRVHSTAAGAKNSVASTRTAGPCGKSVKIGSKAKAPPPPTIAELTADGARMATLLMAPAPQRPCNEAGACPTAAPCNATTNTCDCPSGQLYSNGACVNGGQYAALLWSAPEAASGGIVAEYWREGDTTSNRKTVFLSSRGRYGKNNPKLEAIELGALPANTVERWCISARTVGLTAVGLSDPSSQLSEATVPLCIERRPPGVRPAEYIPWPNLPRPGLLGTVKVDYLAADGMPYATIASLEGAAQTPPRISDPSPSCGTNPFSSDECSCSVDTQDCGCRPSNGCDPRNPENRCLARPVIVPGGEYGTSNVDQDIYSWPDNHSEVTSRCPGFCSQILAKNTFTNVVAYRRSRSHTNPTEVAPFVQASELIVNASCLFSRQQFRQWRPLVSREGPRRFGADDPNFAVIDFKRDSAGPRSMELVWLDRHPHQDGRDYQYQFVFFDERGEIAGYKESNWLVYKQVGPNHVWTPEGEQ